MTDWQIRIAYLLAVVIGVMLSHVLPSKWFE